MESWAWKEVRTGAQWLRLLSLIWQLVATLTQSWFLPEMDESDIQMLILETEADKANLFIGFPREITEPEVEMVHNVL